MAPITVPGRLPSPPSTQIANTRPIYSRPTDGSTGWMMISSAPATAVVAMEMPNAMRLIRIGEAPIKRNESVTSDPPAEKGDKDQPPEPEEPEN